MAESAPRHYLVSFEGVSASVGGYDISAIMELRLSAAANGIPQLTLLVNAGPEDAGGGTQVEAVSLANAREGLDRCRAMVRTDGGTLSLSLTCRLDGPTGSETQSLSLSGWLLTDVALSPVQRRGVCTASLTFQHPVCKAHLGGTVPGLVAIPPVLDGLEDSNPLAVFVRALRLYAVAQRSMSLPAVIPGASPPDVVREQLLSRLEKATSDLEAAVRWTHGGLPAFGHLAGWGDLLCKGLAVYASPGGNSVLQSLLGGLVPECSLALGGDYTQAALELGPFEPWADASVTIDDSDIVSLAFPQTDPAPISGVKMVLSDTGSGLGVSYHVEGCQAGEKAYPAETFYIPDSELAAQYLYGPIQQFQEPGWMVRMAELEHNKSAAPVSDARSASSGGLVTSATVPRDGAVAFAPGGAAFSSSIDYSQAMLACAKAYF